ncbi:MAG TPA: PaaI family thioesterase [Acidimicrobiia bacterium]|nr:PaaI family thioesterase [Acidimicrobiia bacterium]
MKELRDRIAAIFDRAPFMGLLGVRLVDAGEGWVETEMELTEQLLQQHGFAHAGVVSTLADHTAGAAATTAVDSGHSVLTANYPIHLLRPGAGTRLTSRGEVVRAGRALIVAEADVWADGTHCARYTGTMAVVERPLA